MKDLILNQIEQIPENTILTLDKIENSFVKYFNKKIK